MIIFKTQGMEEAAHLLAMRYHHVRLECIYRRAFPVRMRVKSLKKMNPIICRTGDIAQAELWRKQGGVIVNYDKHIKDGVHDAMLYCEAPFSLAEMGNDPYPIVIYRSPSWEGHFKELPRITPNAKDCRAFLNIIAKSEMNAECASICDALGYDTEGVKAVSDAELCKRLDLPILHLMALKRILLKRKGDAYFNIVSIVQNVPPEDKSLFPIYEAVCNLRQVNGMRIVLNHELWLKVSNWKKQLKRLARCGSVTIKDKIGFYALDGIKFDLDHIQANYDAARTALCNVIEMVDLAPTLTPAALDSLSLSRPEPLQPSDVPEQPAA